MSTNNTNQSNQTNFTVEPIHHASLILSWAGESLYADPVGADRYAGKADANIILLTHAHPDHFDVPTLEAVTKSGTDIVAPQAVYDQMPKDLQKKTKVMKNGDKIDLDGFSIEAIPAYNLPESPTSYHPKGVGNGYVIEKNAKRVYIAGDTSGTPEMHILKDIDVAFIPMNPPYTMSPEEAAEVVNVFEPKMVYPYHFKTPDGFADVDKFIELVHAKHPNIEIMKVNWYPGGQ